ncbi:cation:proton antiporter [Maioricimonas rarisocia]|nr:cation:proton antiporter [Maioricimonas rarisocia]
MRFFQSSPGAPSLLPDVQRGRQLLLLLTLAGLLGLVMTSVATAQAAPVTDMATPEAVEPDAAAADDPGHELHAADESHAAGHDDHAGGHIDPVANVLLAIVIILLLAKVGGDLFERVGMPAVLGELVIGILIGNAALITGWHGFDFFHAPPEAQLGDPYSAGAVLKMLAGIGVVLLLFEVGLESSVRDMMSVGSSSLLVALLGVVAPMGLGYLTGLFFVPEAGWQVHLFLGATLCATSVGITARVLKDLGRSQQRESQIILGAAVIDDVLGLVVLAIVSGVITQGADFEPMSLVVIVLKAFGFLFAAVLLGTRLFTRPLFRIASYLRGHGMLVATALVVCFGFSWLANQVGLAPIVGAFAAGLILERAHYRELGKKENVELEEALEPLTALLVPIFFVQMGIMVDLSSFADASVWGLAAAITVAAVIGKQVCAFGILEKGLNRTAVGLGMIPRGEVGLIFANVGLALQVGGVPVISPGTYSAVVVMVMLTTMVTPPLLKWSMTSGAAPEPESPETGGEPVEESAAHSTADVH